ncbi:MAG: right-handed parallel beta-helix repeat-containing protein [Kofleriaceae bacterium]|nr:right-handed parallel beta-helix repeat-containing protein [Kofleriaceae bacterium]
MNTRTLYLALTLALASACSTPEQDTSFCDSTVICDQQSDIPFCDIANNTCIAPPSANACNTVVPCEDATLPICMNDASSGVCVECLDTSDCTGSTTCNTMTNSCDSFSCTEDAAGNASCLENFPDLAFCGDAGACVECRESGHCADNTAAVCENFVCGACTSDSECDGLCEAGDCVDSLRFVYVATDGTANAGCGREDNPCNSVALGLSETTEARNELRIQAGTYSQQLDFTGGTRVLRAMGTVVFDYSNAQVDSDIPLVSVENSASLSIFGIDFGSPGTFQNNSVIRCLNNSGTLLLDSISTLGGGSSAISSSCALTLIDSTITNPTGLDGAVQVKNGGSADISGTTLIGDYTAPNFDSSFEGIRCSGGSTLTISNSSVSGFATGVKISNCDTTLRSSNISNNLQSGLNLSTSSFDITNNFFVNNGDVQNSSGRGVAIFNSSLANPTSQRFDFNTIAGNRGSSTSINMSCNANNAAPIQALGNILWDAVPISSNVGLSNCSFVSSSVEGMTDFEPEFVNPVAGANGDYHLKPNSACIDKVDTDTLDIDFDGDKRPMGIRHDMGADEAL